MAESLTMSTTALYQILVDLGVEPEKAERALATLACEDEVATKTDLAKLSEQLTWRMAVMTGVILAGVGVIVKM